jgi:hypothetical protein
MRRSLLFALPVLAGLGCHQKQFVMPMASPVGGVAQPPFSTGDRRFPNQRSQVYFVSPEEMKVGWETMTGNAKVFAPAQLTVPGRYNFDQGAVYRLKVTDIPGRAGVELYPTLEVAPSGPRTDAYLTHNAVPIEFSDEDFEQVTAGNFVTKVIYLPDPEYQELAIAGVETLVSTRLDPGVDPVAEADRRGTILAIVRLGGIDLETPQGGPVSAYNATSSGPGIQAVPMAPPAKPMAPATPPAETAPALVPPKMATEPGIAPVQR